ncbi:RibD family protein [Orrella daihaiensis]|uniref:RibD family protein n=1 Tax=Orrella daihaiensis TaxID=2782176 RepID=A0ABY4AKI3_9BURK|nr:RibD family protein [Orrella daihaiensis]UOD50788.1 RibD family protein [Orrella daihaiensis]
MKTSQARTWNCSRLKPGVDGLTVVGQLGQSLDGQIATATGHSKYINGDGGLAHLHALRAWAQVVVIGVGTLVADNPRLTVRLLNGQSPDRVVIDPSGRAPADATCLLDQSVRRVILTAPGHTRTDLPAGVQQIHFGGLESGQKIDPEQLRQWFASQGWQRVLIEGGAATLAVFLNKSCLDYLHLITSPLILGPGVAGIRTIGLSQLSEAKRFKAQAFDLGHDLLMECAF